MKEKTNKKVLIVSPCKLPIPSVLGGAVETLLDNIINENEKNKKLDLTVISIYNRESERISKKIKYTEFKFIKVNTILTKIDKVINLFLTKILRKDMEGNILEKIKINIKIKKELLNNKYDAIILENCGFFTHIYKGKVKKEYRGKFYYHIHNEIPSRINHEFIENEKIIAISKFIIKNAELKLNSKKKLNSIILKNGIDIDKFHKNLSIDQRQNLRNRLGFNENDIVICFVGRIVKEKGILELLEAIEKIKGTNIKLMIVGSVEFGNKKTSEFEKKIKNKSEKLNNRVKMTGFIENEDIWKYYKISDIAILPSIWEEPAGLTMIEAIATETILITTRVGGIPEYIKDNMALLINNDKHIVENIKKAIECVINNFEIYKKKTNNACELIIKEYSTVKFYENFCNIINNGGKYEQRKNIFE